MAPVGTLTPVKSTANRNRKLGQYLTVQLCPERNDSRRMETDYPEVQRVRFMNPDINYLTSRTELEPAFFGRMLRLFGEGVVLETLRRIPRPRSEGFFLTVCREVESEGV